MRQVILDTETTGLEPSQGHRIIEIGCVEMVGRKLTGRNYHQYINPERVIDEGAIEVHGITNEFVADKPVFADVAQEFLEYIKGAELVIHNAPFDVGFMDHEFKMVSKDLGLVADHCEVIDTLVMARQLHPGQRNNLDALCKRYDVDNSQRDLHGALLDAEILADVYIAMTSGQTDLALSGQGDSSGGQIVTGDAIRRLDSRPELVVRTASAEERASHEEMLDLIQKKSDGTCLWRQDVTTE